jgi:hypothetical protein
MPASPGLVSNSTIMPSCQNDVVGYVMDDHGGDVSGESKSAARMQDS